MLRLAAGRSLLRLWWLLQVVRFRGWVSECGHQGYAPSAILPFLLACAPIKPFSPVNSGRGTHPLTTCRAPAPLLGNVCPRGLGSVIASTPPQPPLIPHPPARVNPLRERAGNGKTFPDRGKMFPGGTKGVPAQAVTREHSPSRSPRKPLLIPEIQKLQRFRNSTQYQLLLAVFGFGFHLQFPIV